jgi:hypothetical protein
MMMCNAIETVAIKLPPHSSLKLHQLVDKQAFQNSLQSIANSNNHHITSSSPFSF